MTVTVPNDEIQGADLWELFSHRNVGNRPGHGYQGTYYNWPADRHLELMDDGPLQRALGRCNYRILTSIELQAPEACAAALQSFVEPLSGEVDVDLVAVFRRVACEVMYRLLFREAPDPDTLDLLDAAMANYALTIKGRQVRSRRLRQRALARIRERVDAEDQRPFRERFDVRDEIPRDLLSLHVYSTLFATATIQLSDLMGHCLLETCANARIAEAFRRAVDHGEPACVEAAAGSLLDETLRMFPLIVMVSRVTTGPVTLQSGARLAAGTDIALDLTGLRRYWRDPDRFCPQRWHDPELGVASPFADDSEGPVDVLAQERSHFVPFGLGPRGCPAAALSRRVGTELMIEAFRSLAIATPRGYPHSRQLRRGVPARVRRRAEGALCGPPRPSFVRRHLPSDRNVSPGSPRSVLENLLHDITASRRLRAEFLCPAVTYADLVLSKHGILR